MPSPKVASARTIANRQARVVINRAALDEIQMRIADGLLALGQKIIAEAAAAAPRDPEIAARRGVPMMADTGHALVYALGKKVAGEEGQTGKPRSMKAPKDQVVLGVWFSSPLAHFAELGTINEPARPFLTPAVMANVPNAGGAVSAALAKRTKAGR